ncbi:tRNA threonylcarbamoyladenosine biosynthesis protein [Spiroplasma helicoides]|uniref:L-threonylcarbamoyladenylate synthase n=1 Tax=Spiroplasma helicoides TaxID=216938 RepID=A0A1B3SM88_9MOLU|nr:Sua5/YciO/YrdC/YwlC family protein [Spiroplasma helicoides]AOG61046.1 tRNA threonylcarbamoyladenosine biosynthesis protein [Spiroplasma helicoides]
MVLLNEEQIKRAINLLIKNDVIILPTDTIYGLSARAITDNQNKINNMKKSELNKPLIILVANVEQAKRFIDLTKEANDLLNSKEPTTVISKLKDSQTTYAIRLVKRDDIKEIITKVGPIYSTSVNISDEPHLKNKKDLEEFIDMDHCFFTENLENSPSNIVDLILNKKKR